MGVAFALGVCLSIKMPNNQLVVGIIIRKKVREEWRRCAGGRACVGGGLILRAWGGELRELENAHT